ncbi:TetR/AcrR family transcriptional regulator [Micromonospora sp. KC606]|uniref:TetR/AcrR family transcriptional regulator n=1 Tax=Micromonospora sp. KC606 TaxID=2530379 RepID=UPI001FB5E303|nr:TetR/AcrR family transcriptional regulator [Micromonospora sp. KC606]
MTIYGHFRTRPELVEAALADALQAGEQMLVGVDLDGDAQQAMNRLLASSWSLVAESAALLTAAQAVLPAGRLRELHTGAADRVEQLIRRGQEQGVFRTDLPITWLVNAVHYLLNGAAEETRLGRLDPASTADVVTATVQAVLATPPANDIHPPR